MGTSGLIVGHNATHEDDFKAVLKRDRRSEIPIVDYRAARAAKA
jgi:hypothetical protein